MDLQRCVPYGSLIFLGSLILHADTVTLKNGKTFEGKIIKEGSSEIQFRLPDATIKIPQKAIKSSEKKESIFDTYESKAKEAPDTADGHFKLGHWANENNLTALAKEEWKKAIEKDDNHEAARKALGYVKVDGAWLNEKKHMEEKGQVWFEGKFISKEDGEKKALERAVGVEFDVTYDKDATKEELDKVAKNLASCSGFLWNLTEGQIYIKEIKVRDQTKGGKLRLQNLDKKTVKDPTGGTVGGYAPHDRTHIVIPGAGFTGVIVHEWCHMAFNVFDEPTCRCLMNSGGGTIALCDEKNHFDKDKSCWEKVLKKYPQVKHPNPDWHPKKPPETTITVEDK